MENLPEPEIVKDLRCDFFWRVVYGVCAALVAVYVLFDMLDLDGSSRYGSQHVPKGTLWVADATSEADTSLPPGLPPGRGGKADDSTDRLFAAASFPGSAVLTFAVLALSRRHRYRVALPRSGAKIVQALKQDYGCSVLLQNGSEHVLLCPRSRLSEAVGFLRGKGIDASAVADRADYVFAEINQLGNRLRQALKG